jgi:ABC-2 type transport system permease protein
MMSVMGWGVLAILILVIPSLNIALPGLVTGWIKLIPSFYLVDTVHQVINFGAGWADVGGNLLILLAFSLAFLALGVLALRRKFR